MRNTPDMWGSVPGSGAQPNDLALYGNGLLALSAMASAVGIDMDQILDASIGAQVHQAPAYDPDGINGMPVHELHNYAHRSRAELEALRNRYADLQQKHEANTTAFNFLRRQLKANGHDDQVIDDMDPEQLARYLVEISGGYIHDLS